MESSPISASLGAIGSLPRKLDELLATKHWTLRGVVNMEEIEELTADLRVLHSFMQKLSNAQDPRMSARYWMKDVRELSYDMEDFADQFVQAHGRAKIYFLKRRRRSHGRAKIRGATCRKLLVSRLKISRLPGTRKWRPWITNMVSEFRTRAQDASRRYSRYKLDDCVTNPGYSLFSHELPTILQDPGDLVGIEGPMNELERWLLNGEEQLKVVSIVGVGGIGKTTLAQKLWGKLHVQFECGAFVRTAQKPDMRGILRNIFLQVRPHQSPNAGDMRHLINDLREYLQGKRYFIIIDDLWSSSVWDVVSRAFPQSGCCSRIITTTEIMEVALACCFCPGNTFKMEPLSDNDSQKLLLQRILVSGNQSPQQFDDVIPQILRSCGGLPLAIIIVARILASQPEKLEQWGSAHNSFDSIFGVNPTMEGFMGKILNICFISLPHYLKTCLLYLSTYPEGYLFLKDDLVKQWVAEGFICAKEGEDMEEVARRYFDELVSMGLIQVMDINCNYDLFSYSVHQLVLDLITYKSIEQNFITVVDYSQTTIRLSDKVRRLSLHFGSATYATIPASTRLSQVRSLFFSGLFNCMPSFVMFKLLRVLTLHVWDDTGTTDLNLTGICELLWLRYLQVTCNVTVTLPERIEAMKHLETVDVNAQVCDVPLDIVRLSSLLHLCLQGGNLPSGIGGIRSLRTLKYFDLGNSSEDSLWGLGELRNLQDLHLTYSSSPSSEHLKRNLIALAASIGKLCNLKSLTLAPGTAGMVVLFDGWSNMSVPIFLEKLELLPPICIFSRLPRWIGQLRRICIMKVAVRELHTTDIAILSWLHSLTVLSLSVQIAPEGRTVFNDKAFPVLKYFKFRCGVLCMTFMAGAMPNLRRLKLVFNIHTGERYDNMLVGIEHLLSLQDIVGQIGAATESDWRAAEFAINNAIDNHPMVPRRNLQWVDLVEEESRPSEKHHWSQEKGSLGEKHGVLEKSAIHYSTKYHTPIRGKNMEPTDDETDYVLSKLEMFSAGDATSVFSDEADDASSTQPSVIGGDQTPFWHDYYYSSDDNIQGITASSASPCRGFGSSRSNSSLPPGAEDGSVGSDGQDEDFSLSDPEEAPRNACGQELGTSASVYPSAARASPPTDPAFHSDLLHVLDKLRGMIAAIELQSRPERGGSGMVVTRRVSRFFRLLELRIAKKLPSGDADACALRRNDHATTGSASWPMASSSRGHGERHSARPRKKTHCLPVLGGAPFVVCSGCCDLLQAPTSTVPSRRRGNIRLRCGGCDEVLELAHAAPPGIAGRAQTAVTTLGNTSKVARATLKKRKKRLSGPRLATPIFFLKNIP